MTLNYALVSTEISKHRGLMVELLAATGATVENYFSDELRRRGKTQ